MDPGTSLAYGSLRTRLRRACCAAHSRSCRGPAWTVLVVAALLVGCSDPAASPEDEVRAALMAIETAAEAGDASAFSELVSERYEDPYGHDREKLEAFVAFHVMRSGRGREVIVRVRDVHIEPSRPDQAAVTLALGLAGAGSRLSAQVYAVDVDLVREEGDWRVAWAQWRAAPASDLL
ncbi:MAG: hypothetical protein ABFS41_03920 [Myxococcota bacterium]